MPCRHLAWTALACLAVTTIGPAQPTYKLGVKPDLVPHAVLRIDGTRVSRSDVQDDPGFRLQYHIMKDGKTLAVVDARANPALELPQQGPGTYVVFLELFYPAYKAGNQQKGSFRPISNIATCQAGPDAAGKLRFTDVGVVRNSLFYGLTAGKLLPVPEVPPVPRP